MTGGRRLLWAALAVALTASVAGAGCGGSDDESAAKPPPPAQPEDFPKPAGRGIGELRETLGDDGPVLVPTVSLLEPGRNRFGFGLFDRARAQIADVPVALYVAPVAGGPTRGPFIARYESLEVKPQFQSRSTATDPDAAKSLYVAELRLPEPGRYDVLGVARLDDRLVVATSASAGLTVRADGAVPDVGDRAPATDTPTEADTGGDIREIDTREPPSTMHEVSFASVVGRQPAVLLFATPGLCQSRVCGPVVDIAEQVKSEHGDRVAFVHQEIFRDNEVDRGYRPQVLDWGLPTEPWAFAVDGSGRVVARLEGAFSSGELERAVEAAAG